MILTLSSYLGPLWALLQLSAGLLRAGIPALDQSAQQLWPNLCASTPSIRISNRLHVGRVSGVRRVSPVPVPSGAARHKIGQESSSSRSAISEYWGPAGVAHMAQVSAYEYAMAMRTYCSADRCAQACEFT